MKIVVCLIAVLMLFCCNSFAATEAQIAKESVELENIELVVQQAEALIRGDGVEKDVPAGLKLYKQAAKSGSVKAMSRLGRLYRFGLEGAPKSRLRAVYWALRCKWEIFLQDRGER